MEIIKIFLEYTSLGYDVYFTSIVGKDAITMTKRYSHKSESKLHCQQIYNHNKLDEGSIRSVLEFMYNDIQEQEKTGEYKELINV